MVSRRRLAELRATRWRELSADVSRLSRLLALPDVQQGLRQGVLLALAGAAVLLPPSRAALSHAPAPPVTVVAAAAPPATVTARLTADFGSVEPSSDVRTIVDWVAASTDNQRLPFAVLDKRGARVYVFDARARLLGTSMVLLGSAVGDDTPPGVGNKALADILAHERITPAGRFVSRPGRDDVGNDVVWVDYDAAVAMHRVQVIDPKEKRFERIASPFVHDKRISNGCINVPIAFFDATVKPTLGASRAVVYILPDVKPIEQVFAAAYATPPARENANL